MRLFDSIPSRIVLFTGMMLQCCALGMFTLSTQYNWQAFARFLSGFSQVILSIYLPVWVDAFAPKDRKTKWMTYIITAAPAGLFTGYSMSALIVSFDISWQWAFYIHIILLLPISQVFFVIKPHYLDVAKRNSQQAVQTGIERDRREILIVDPDAPMPLPEKKQTKELSEYERWNKEMMEIEEQKTMNYTFNEKFKYVLTQPNYVLQLFAITCLFVTVTGI